MPANFGWHFLFINVTIICLINIIKIKHKKGIKSTYFNIIINTKIEVFNIIMFNKSVIFYEYGKIVLKSLIKKVCFVCLNKIVVFDLIYLL
jgi:hypothetical protein